jgi:DNA-binding NtrC family response regulator
LFALGWPGNVRELQNRIERALVFSESSSLSESDLFPDKSGHEDAVEGGALTLDAYIAAAEKAYIEAVLETHGGRITAAAAALGISRKTLWEKMRRHAVRVGLRDEVAERLN